MNELMVMQLRLREQNRIYEASPGVTATFRDLARVNEDMMELIAMFRGKTKQIGFKNEQENNGANSTAVTGSDIGS